MTATPLNIVSLARGEIDPLQLTLRERELLGFALDRFGGPLAAFLLTGLGEEAGLRQRTFTVTFSDGRGARYERGITVTAEERTSSLPPLLPNGKEPLVMLSFLRLLIEGRRLSSFVLRYKSAEVLRLLGWGGAEQGERVIDDTATRYFCLDYRWEVGRKELAARGLSFYSGAASLVSGYYAETTEEGGTTKQVRSQITFAEEFVRELMERSLFGVNWNGVSSLEYVNS